MTELNVDDFARFVGDVYGQEPFGWQRRLVQQVLATGEWPALLDLPTAAGKTMALDVALFTLAANPLVAPRRIVFVVDRRVIVSQVASKVRRLREAFASTPSDIVADIGQRLRRAFGTKNADAPPFLFAELRGGIALDETWARRPDVPTVLVSTVDQVGSRLLFRGYGVSRAMQPVHAGLLGNDVLFLLDEVHLSRPFAQTLREIRDLHRPATRLPDRWQVVEMTATPGQSVGDVLTLDAHDLAPTSQLGPRLRAVKAARLRTVGAARQDPEEALTEAIPNIARSLPGRVVGVIVNRVATATRVAKTLKAGGEDEERVVLVTGRMRPLDRDELWDELAPQIQAGRTRGNGPRLFLVATQAVEAGADIDLDSLVTEIAPIDSMRQRFGRVDRLGTLCQAGTPTQIVVVAGRQQASASFEDPVYGTALAATWRTLEKAHGDNMFDAGPLSTDLPTGTELLAPSLDAPLLLRSHIDVLVQTNPRPRADPDVSLWLHGPQNVPAEVNVVWRADVSDRWLEAAAKADEQHQQLVELMLVCPPKSSEALTLPLWAARAWLTGAAAPAIERVADVDQASPPVANGEGASLVVRWAGPETEVVDVSRIRPGDTLVIPSARGGLRNRNWDAQSSAAVTDLGDRAQLEVGAALVLRLHAAVVGPHVGHGDRLDPPPRPDNPDSQDELRDPQSEVAAWLDTVLAAEPPHWLHVLCKRLRGHEPLAIATGTDGDSPTSSMYVLLDRKRLGSSRANAGLSEAGLELDGSDVMNSFIGARVLLDGHLDGVGSLTRRFAASCGLPTELQDDLELAARLHDLGKADPRFQIWLCDGDEITASRQPGLLAKSGADHRDARRRALAREDAGYPAGTRHELLSVALAQSQPELLRTAHDTDLVLHLIASHHGYCRALPPPQPDPWPQNVSVTWDGHQLQSSSDHGLSALNSGVGDRFWAVTRRYGPHGLAWLEAVLRLADHRRSALEQREARP